jgi:Fe-Mn family superoxide dismutase
MVISRRNRDMNITRRDALVAVAAIGLAAVPPLKGSSMSNEKTLSEIQANRPVGPGSNRLVPLPFDPGKLRGLSERMLVSHHENNYAGAVKNLNKVEDQLATITKDTPGFVVTGLRERELTFTNSVVLHEAYFANLGGDGKAVASVERTLSDTFAAMGRFEELFRATAMSLAGGSGWTILDYSFPGDDLRIYGSGGHAQSVAFGAPLLVLDMYEHAYAIDYGAGAADYVDAFFMNVRWDEVARRLERAKQAARAMKG